MPCELFCNQCCFTFPSKVFRAPFIEAKDLFLHEVLFLLMFSIDAQLGFCQGGGRVTPCHISKLLTYVDHDLFCEADPKTDCGKL